MKYYSISSVSTPFPLVLSGSFFLVRVNFFTHVLPVLDSISEDSAYLGSLFVYMYLSSPILCSVTIVVMDYLDTQLCTLKAKSSKLHLGIPFLHYSMKTPSRQKVWSISWVISCILSLKDHSFSLLDLQYLKN